MGSDRGMENSRINFTDLPTGAGFAGSAFQGSSARDFGDAQLDAVLSRAPVGGNQPTRPSGIGVSETLGAFCCPRDGIPGPVGREEFSGQRHNGGLSNGLQWTNPTGFLSNVTKLETLTPAKFDAWFEQVSDCLAMAGNMPREQQATMLRMTLGQSVRDLIKILPPERRNDPELLVAFLRETARPNRDAERFSLLRKALGWKQGAAMHADYITSYEKVLTRLRAMDLRLDDEVCAYVLLQGLTSQTQRDIILSQGTQLRYDRIRAAIMGLTSTTTTRRTAGAYYGSDDSDSDADDTDGSDRTSEGPDSDSESDWENADFAKIKRMIKKRVKKGKAPFPRSWKKGKPR